MTDFRLPNKAHVKLNNTWTKKFSINDRNVCLILIRDFQNTSKFLKVETLFGVKKLEFIKFSERASKEKFSAY